MPGRTGSAARTAAALAAVLLTVTAPSAAVALPESPAELPSRAGEFNTSFETTERQPDWRNSVDLASDGQKRSSGVHGGFSTGIPGNVTDRVKEVRASGEHEGAGETKENLVDLEPTTKWLEFAATSWIEFDTDAPVRVSAYALTSANDEEKRDPRDWTLKGSADGREWTVLDTRAEERFEQRHQTRTFTVGEPGQVPAYAHYRLEITRNNGAPLTQLADVQFSNGDTSAPVPDDMRSLVDRGPTGSPTAKPKAGFTGLRALRYAGTHRAEGRGYSYNRVFDVDLPVGRDTELSYRVYPAMAEGVRDYAATQVAVDLAFTDGTLLSELAARDSHGGRLSPQGQGEAKRLYVNQWNQVRSLVGEVAAGRTVDRILVAYDSARGPARFQGWIDDITLRPKPPERRPERLSDYASTTRGTNSAFWFSRGNTFPATAVPHGFNFWTPVTRADSTDWLYEYQRGNNAANLPTVKAFSASHEPSPWMGDRQTFQLMPSAAPGTPETDRERRALAFRHENETARPHYYDVTFENGLRAELAPTDHAATMRFTYPGDDASVVFDNVTQQGGLTLDAASASFSGFSDVRSGLSTGATRLFVHGVFDAPVTGSASEGVRGHFRFDAGADRTVVLRIATSLISVDQARKNLADEIPPGTPFEEVKERAQDAWDALLGRVEVEGATEDQRVTLYSSLYRLYLYPNSGFENTGTKERPRYRYASPFSPMTGPDTPTHTGAKIVDGTVYVNNGFWDTYRTTWPAYSFLTPRKAGELIEGFVQQYRDGGWISRWSSPGYADLMTGTSSDVAFADAYVKGVRGFDAKAAYEAALKNATVVPPAPGVGRKGMTTSPFTGYASTATHEGLSWSLEGHLNDYGISRMARALYERTGEKRYREEAEYFAERARNYVTLFDRQAGFFQGRDPKGQWRVPSASYDPRIWGYDYTETNGWGYAFTAPQDSRGLANLYGGRAELGRKLDTYFATPETASPEFKGSYSGVIHEMTEARDVRMGMYGHSNQVAHHVTYMYNAASQPWKTQEKVREVLSRLYTGSEIGQGYHGDEDNGEQSAWYLFSALGFYPLVMGSGEYAIGSPLFRKVTVKLDGGRELVVKAPRNSARNIYVQGLKVNGKPWHSTALPHGVVARGGTLEFAMGPEPSAWGTGKGAAPVSLTRDDRVPEPRRDAVTGAGELFDDSSATSGELTAGAVELPVPAGTRAVQYTLTSADRASAPTGWVLQGSQDGTVWRDLDRRSQERFTWDRQTRVFSVPRPGTYPRYRLVPEGGGGARLAEIELLA
ncbi:GH92 family glycosyl hydrolase [Streptomyces clavuligerus]|nr:alpha-mannosidase [Streptomyces clavuligerus]AXU16433.1 glycoside hydrolase family 92 protein [Streptomyces clavuligerus]MBY6301997.1 GH92 family glycosyl hydrolase [Streptomyces clavuligerus]QCS09197.1 alpha-mannosidase [Streptomyces clavuligerus]QPJ96870.1 glycoside hydrolase family 92 protein [Streptomyces clavuligerus]